MRRAPIRRFNEGMDHGCDEGTGRGPDPAQWLEAS